MMNNIYQKTHYLYHHDCYRFMIDDKIIKTPAKNPLTSNYKKLADIICNEWHHIIMPLTPEQIPMTSIQFAVIDHIATQRDTVIKQTIDRLEFDTIRFFAPTLTAFQTENPLYARQQKYWLPIINWFNKRFDYHITVIKGDTQYFSTSDNNDTHDVMIQILSSYHDEYLTLVNQFSALTGSLILALAIIDNDCDIINNPTQIIDIALMERLFQYEQWGIDAQTEKELNYDKKQLYDLWQYYQLLADE